MMHEVFISYSRSDHLTAKLIADRLTNAGLTVYLDVEGVVAGESWSQSMERALTRASAVVVLLSSNSRRSTSVEDEVQKAIEGKKLVIPVLLDDKATENWLWPLLATRQSLRLDLGSRDMDRQLSTLVDTLGGARASVESSAPAAYVVRSWSRTWKTIALVLISAVIGAVSVWLFR